MPAHPFPQRILCDECFELPNELAAPTELEFGFDSLLQRRQPQLLQPPDLALRKRGVGHVCNWRPVPECERLAELVHPFPSFPASCFLKEPFEARRIESVRLDLDQVARWAGNDHFGAEQLAQLRHEIRERRRRRRWRLSIPELLDDALGRNNFAGVKKQESEERALLLAAKRERPGLGDDLNGSKDPELEHSAVVTPGALPA